MAKTNKKSAKKAQNKQAHDERVQALAQEVAEHDDVEIVAEVDIDNKAVSDVVIIRDTDNGSADDGSNTTVQADGLASVDVQTAIDKGQKTADAALTQVSEKLDDAKQGAIDTLDTLAQQADDAKDNAVQKAQDAQASAAQMIDSTKAQAAKKIDEAKQTAEELKHQAKDKADELKHQTADALHDAAQQVHEMIDDAKQSAESLKQTAIDKIDELKQTAGEKSDQLKSQLEQKVDALKSSAEALKQQAEASATKAMTDAETATLTASIDTYEKIEETADHTKQQLNQLLTQGKSALDEKLQAVGEKFGVTEQINTLSHDAETAGTRIKDEMQALQMSAQESLSAAKQAGDAYESHHGNKGLGAKLGKLGAYLAGAYGAKQSAGKQYKSVDIDQAQFEEDAFHAQGSFFVGQLFGTKAVAAQNLASKFVPKNKFEAVGEMIYNQVAQWASAWAMNDLKKDNRFKLIDTMNIAQRTEFAQDIANQNRALATLGGVAGLAGLKGVVADMAWLLMVSLRTVYQLSAIYDQPLTGKEGIKKAYGVLSGANLEKLQEKQVLLTALALGQGMLKSAQETGIESQLQELGSRYKQSEIYTKQFEELHRFVDLDRFNPSWLNKLLPIVSVGIGAYYNQDLIDEVIGTAMATFAPAQQIGQADEPMAAKITGNTSDLSSN